MAAANTQAEEDEKLLLECVGELRRVFDYICESIDHVRNKALALLVGEVAIATFLFTADGHNLLKKHTPVYGYVAFGIGVALFFFAFYKFLAVIATIHWQYPTEEHDMKNPTARFNHSNLEFLQYLHSEYMSKIGICIPLVKQRSAWFMQGVYALSAGVLFIILIKYGGGA